MKTPLIFEHTFASGRKITFTANRKPGTKPLCISSIQCRDLTTDELSEYIPWRNSVVATLMSTLTPEEVLASNK